MIENTFIQLTSDQFGDLMVAAFVLNVGAVFVAFLMYDAFGWLLGKLMRSTSPEEQRCTSAGGVALEQGDDISTLGGHVNAPAGSCRPVGQVSAAPSKCPDCGSELYTEDLGGHKWLSCRDQSACGWFFHEEIKA